VTPSADCYSCAQEAVTGKLPPRESIAADAHWRVAHAFGTALEGWLVLIPRRHITSISELSDAEAQSLGIWQVRLSQALHQVVGCQKTYIAQFAEAEGFAHVHFHVIPRSPDLPEDLRGPRIFQMMQADEDALVTEQRMDQIARELSDYLARTASASPPARNTTATPRASARRPWL
jgi:diadenosine tetraphosphate (Ap4A) HIT family hydrolase